MIGMDSPRFQLRISTLLGLVACVAVNFWLFRLGPLLGLLGLNVTKHVAIAFLCQASGINRRGGAPVPGPAILPVPSPAIAPRPHEDRGHAVL